MRPLSEKEQQILNFITETIRTEGFSPSVRDIQKALGIKSTATVHSYLNKLEAKGYILKEDGKSRTLRIDGLSPAEKRRTAKIPILGKVTAGMPILAVENYEGYVDFPMIKKSFDQNELFALRVRGESMIEAGILDNDIVVVQRGNYAENGEIVVALIDDEATVKTFYKEDGHFRLQPQNPTMEPIIVDDLYILGKVVAVFRYY